MGTKYKYILRSILYVEKRDLPGWHYITNGSCNTPNGPTVKFETRRSALCRRRDVPYVRYRTDCIFIQLQQSQHRAHQ